MSTSEHSSQASSSRASRSGRRRTNITTTALFPMLKSLSSVYHPKLIAAGIALELLQTLSFALNPHTAGHRTTWSILYVVQAPYWDSNYATGLTYSGFLAFYWVITGLLWVFLAALVVGVEYTHFVSSVLMKGAFRHLINLYVGVMFVPTVQTLLSTLSCVPTPTPLISETANTLWLFPGQVCTDTIAQIHYGISIALMILWTCAAMLVASTNFAVEMRAKSFKKRGHPYMDIVALLYKVGICVSFQLFMSRGMQTYYSFVLAIASFAMAFAYGFVLPFVDRWLNELHVVNYSLVGWASIVVFIAEKIGSPVFVNQGGFYAVLAIGGCIVGTVAYIFSGVRYNPQTDYLVNMCTASGFVPPEKNPFAIAAQNANPEMLPFPKYLPMSDFVFSPHRFVETDVIEEALRHEESMEDGSSSGVEGNNRTMQDEDALAANRMQRYIKRVQVVSPTIEVAWLPTDAEVSSRFLVDWIRVTDSPPTPHMLSFACRLFARFLLKYPTSPTATIAYVRFLTEYAPSLSRMNLSVKLLDSLPNEMFCDVHHLFQIYLLTMSVKEVLGVRDKNHEKMYRRSRRLHRETLIQTASLWRSLLEEDHNPVNLCFLLNNLSEVRQECTQTYLQAMNTASDDEVLFRSFANFVENVTQDHNCFALCQDEADAISRRRRAKLLQRVENVGGIGAQAGDTSAAAQSLSKSSMSRMHRGEDDAIIALKNIVSAVKAQVDTLSQNLGSRMVFTTAVILFVMICLVVVAHAAVVLSQFSLWKVETDRTTYAGDLRSRSQEIVVALYRVASLLPVDNTTIYSQSDIVNEVNKLLAYTYAFESSVNFMTYGAGQQADGQIIQFIKNPQVFLRQYPTSLFFDVQSFNYWNAANTLVQYLTRIASTALKFPYQQDFLKNTDVLFVSSNVPSIFANMFDMAVGIQLESQARLGSSTNVAYGVALAIFGVLVLSGAYVFVWNFRHSASAKVQALNLFMLIPRDAVKRISDDAKSRVEKFVSGENMEKEDHRQIDNLGGSINDAATNGADGGGVAEFEDDDGRRSSYTSKLLAHLFQTGGLQTDEEEEGAKGESDQIVSLLGSDMESASKKASPKTGGGEETQEFTKVGFAPSKEPSEDLETQKKQPQTPTSKDDNASPKDERRKRHSISLGNAMKNVDKKQRTSILELVEANSASDDETVSGIEAEAHGAAAAAAAGGSLTAEEEEDQHSFMRKSGLTVSSVVVLLLITVTVVVGVAFTAQVLSDETVSALKIDVDVAEITCADLLRNESLDMFFLAQRYVASSDYEDYQNFAVKYKAFIVSKENCLNQLPSLQKTDADLYIKMLTQLQINIEVAVALTAADLTAVESALFSGVRWQAPDKSLGRVAVYRQMVPDIDNAWFAYTTSDADLALPSAQRRDLANRVLYDTMGSAVFLAYLDTQHSLAAAVSSTYSGHLQDVKSTIAVDVAVAIAMWASTIILCIVFVVQWSGTRFARRSAIALALCCVGCVAVGLALLSYSDARATMRGGYARDRLNQIILRENLGKQLMLAYSAVAFPSDASLYNFLDQTQPIYLSNFQGAIVLQMPFASDNPIAINNTLTFISQRGDVNRMIMVAAKLVTTARGTQLFTTEPRMTGVTWNRSAEATDYYMTLKFPSDDALMYSNNVNDLALSASAMSTLAKNIMSTKRLSYYTLMMLGNIDSVLAEQTSYQVRQSSSIDGNFDSASKAFIAIGAVSIFVYLVFALSIGIASINSFSETQLESDMYEALYSGYSTTIGVGLSLVAGCIVAVGVMALAFTASELTDQEVLFASSERSFLAANAMAYAEEMYATSSLNIRLQNRLFLRNIITRKISSAQHTFFSSSSAYSLRSSQNAALFGPDTTFTVRDTRNSILSATTTTTCYNPANSVDGNQRTVIILFEQFFEVMKEIAYLDSLHLVNTTANPSAMATYMTDARLQFETLMNALHVSDEAYKTAAIDAYNQRLYAMLAVLAVALGLVFVVLFAAVIPIIQKMSLHEAGTKLLLTLLPDDVKNTCPEITDFYDADAGTKDDQLKKKLLQSEKLLQNILPPVISRRLKNGERVIADTHPNVTVMFAALIGFDEYSAKMEAKQIVHFLNSLIVTFDQITDLLELEKIKTIGDIYFLCGGLTKKTEGDHPVRCMECGLLFLEAINEHNVRHNTPNLTLRIGINTDPAVAGVIGSKKVAYDLWGDSVNTASRMQSTGLPGKIQVSDKTYNQIKEYFAFTDRKVAAKGKGELLTHIYTGRVKPTTFRNLNWRVAARE